MLKNIQCVSDIPSIQKNLTAWSWKKKTQKNLFKNVLNYTITSCGFHHELKLINLNKVSEVFLYHH